MDISEDDLREFRKSFEDILTDIENDPYVQSVPGASTWLRELLHYNILDGKLIRAKMFLLASFHLTPEMSPEHKKGVFKIGWLLEMVRPVDPAQYIQAEALICDDIMDDATHRRGRLCWHLLPNVGTSALNDVLAVEKLVFILLKKYFRDHPHYTHLQEVFIESIFIGTMGQNLDFRMESQLGWWTPEIYLKIVEAKTGHYSFYLPIALAMTMACVKVDESLCNKMREIMMEIGVFFQIQDDFLDVFGELSVLGKDGTDIQNGKCAWPIVTALQSASSDQVTELKEIYGDKDEAKVSRVKQIFRELKIPELYEEHQRTSMERLLKRVEKEVSIRKQHLVKMIINAILGRKH